MCLILFAYQQHPVYKLIVAANRDEYYQRPTAPAHFWGDYPEVLAGRDLEKMGTWMGVTTNGRFSALTNFRDPKQTTEGKRSRGELVLNALRKDPKEYLMDLEKTDHLYPGYNLLAGDMNELFYYSNIGKKLMSLTPGIYGVSNHLLNTEWPKVKIGKAGMSHIIKEQQEDVLTENLFALLQNSERAEDHLLPKTGVSVEMERILSPMFIKSEGYGTRASTVMLMSEEEIKYTERVFTEESGKEQTYKISL
ncbi:NRDE family protein [Bacillus dakarensis]|uniref:NRDE family protein n=1 Tax=Robertmurraya dakarensis TaxID=1926278 RepID=UPI000981D2F0|nr:NRDE family protein [Bacillus dakarensis]